MGACNAESWGCKVPSEKALKNHVKDKDWEPAAAPFEYQTRFADHKSLEDVHRWIMSNFFLKNIFN